MLIKKIRQTFSNDAIQAIIQSDNPQRAFKIVNGHAVPTLQECLLISDLARKELKKLQKEAEKEYIEMKKLIADLASKKRP